MTHFNDSIQQQDRIQPASVHDLDIVTKRHAQWEAAGILGLSLVILIGWLVVFGWPTSLADLPNTLTRLAQGTLVALMLSGATLSLSFITGEPAIERVLKGIAQSLRTRQALRAARPKEERHEINIAGTNVANEDFKAALAIVTAALTAESKVKDGETLKGKSFSFDRCKDARLVNRWEDWGRIMDLLEAANIAVKPREREGRLVARTPAAAEAALRAYYVGQGYTLFNTVWTKR